MALELVERLEHDHDEAEEHHATVDTLVRRWLENDRLVPNDAAELRERLLGLQSLYRRHISLEDEQLFPAAARVLDAKQIEAIGREMAARRHVLSHSMVVEGSTGRRRTK
jgi:hemerythrin-like domain-containing protein